ncbi:MAG: hypothetical protein IPJ19_12625 [Planctomycetes bacterium]|nr:hypothetical protein [Planctomycetota bacterium]
MKLASILLVSVVCAAQKSAPSKAADPVALVNALCATDGWTREGRGERARLLAQLEGLPPLSDKDVAKWKGVIGKALAKGRKLEKQSGRHWLWDKPKERGLYIVGGETGRPKGLLIAMHGGGAGAGDAGEAADAYQAAAKKLDWLMIAPEVLEKTEHGWTDSGSEEFVMQLVEAALRTWKIEADHVYLSGHSMGGYGTWTIGAHHADRVAGLAASAGAPTPVSGPSGGYEDVIEGVIPSLRNVPIVIYQSLDDPRVPPAANQIAVKKLGEAQARWGGFVHEYWELDGHAHEYPPGGMAALLAKIAADVRDPRPQKIVWQPVLDWKSQFYWLAWEHPRRGALLEAEIDREKNEIRLRGDPKPEHLEVLIDERVADPARELVVLLNDKQVYRGKPVASLATLVKTSLAGDEGLVFPASVAIKP